MKERLKMVEEYQSGRYTVSELAKEYGVSRKTVYKWLGRHAQEGLAGLAERSRAPHRRPNATPLAVAQAVLQVKAAHPRWGPAKLLPPAGASKGVRKAWPAISTRGNILARHGLVTKRRPRQHVEPWTQPFRHADRPNAVWCADFKGWGRTADGTRCDPLTVTDASSRLLLCCQIVAKTDYAHVRAVFEGLFRQYGLPKAIRTDNGTPFASTGPGGLSPLSAWWVKLGIVHERIPLGHPEQNGRHERMHRTLKAETMRPMAATPAAQQARYDAFRRGYNTERPHQALGQVPPATVYTPSPRPYPQRVDDPVYTARTQVRQVRHNGQIKWHGGMVYVSEALAGERVGITHQQQSWLVSFGPITLGQLDDHHQKLVRLPLVPAKERSRPLVTHVHS